MTQLSKNHARTEAADAARCQHRTPAGRRCRSSRSSAASGFCARHSAMQKQRHAADLSADLTAVGDTIQSPEAVNQSLAELYTLLAKNRVSPRRAAVLAYISSLQLRTLSATNREKSLRDEVRKKQPPRIIWDMPCPPYEREDPAQNTPGSRP
jgi:hypothetical protein